MYIWHICRQFHDKTCKKQFILERDGGLARQDFYIKKLLQDRARFADLYNAEIFHGKQILKAELLSPVSLESGIVITDRNGRRQTIQRRRDIAMKASLGACFIAACCEAQGEVHYGMPVRVLTYDALDYTEQLTDIQKEHRKKILQKVRSFYPVSPARINSSPYSHWYSTAEKIHGMVPKVSAICWI